MTSSYYISIRWGAGFHYFQHGPCTKAEALEVAQQQTHQLTNQKVRTRRGAYPTIRILKDIGVAIPITPKMVKAASRGTTP